MIKNSLRTTSYAGFTLLEMLLVMVLMALAATMVVATLPNRSDSKEQAESLQMLLEWAANRAMEEGQIVALNITKNGYRLVVLTRDPTTYQSGWQMINSGRRIRTEQYFPESLQLSLAPDRINQNFEQKPQILMMPGGEITPFSLVLHESGQQGWRLSSNGTLPVSLSSSEGE